MRIVYLGTPDFAVAPLSALYNKYKGDIVAVITNKDKPVGRKQVLTPPPVKVFALEKGIPVYQYDKIKKEGVLDLKNLAPDIMITCAFGQILSQEILDIPTLYTLNIHASLLPKYRGASPINMAILCGEKKTGITIMKTDAGIDTGDVLLQREMEILDNETEGELSSRLSNLGASSILEGLELVENNNAKFIPQDHEKATFSKMIKKEDALIDFNDKTENIINKIRAYNPAPVAYCLVEGLPFKIFSAIKSDKKGRACEVLESEKELIIGTLDGAISLTSVQKAGGKRLDIIDFLRGNKISVGTKFND